MLKGASVKGGAGGTSGGGCGIGVAGGMKNVSVPAINDVGVISKVVKAFVTERTAKLVVLDSVKDVTVSSGVLEPRTASLRWSRCAKVVGRNQEHRSGYS